MAVDTTYPNKRAGYLAAAVLALLLTSGCKVALTSKADPSAYAVPARGFPYRLPISQFTVTLSWTLKDCPSALPTSDVSTAFDVAATYKSDVIEGETLSIDYEKLSKPFKTSDLKIEYHEGTLILKSINATITGKEPEAIGAAIKLGLNVARIGIGLPVPGSGGAAPERPNEILLCPPAIAAMVQEMDRAQMRIKRIPDEAQAIEDQLVVLRLRIASNMISPSDRKRFNALQTQADDLAEELASLKKSLDKIKTRLTYSEEWKLPETAVPDKEPKLFSANSAKLKRWLASVLGDEVANDVKSDSFHFFHSLKPLIAQAECDPEHGCPKVEGGSGIIFRDPVQASLLVTTTGAAKPLLSETVSVAQFGKVRMLGLESDFGESNSLSATFSKDGRLTGGSNKSIEASGVQAIDLANDAASGVLGLIEASRAKREAEEKGTDADVAAARKAELDALTHQITMLENQVKLTKLQGPASPDVDALNAELAVLRLQKEKSDLEAAIKKNQTP
ncbi:MAG: hypothetical protein U0S50_14995 [Sphingopyxis sp.]|uniref:hypothetical protein n=1 Tax=Sphingopyxis sp. TaxID=1908224 RepID=UPI002ABB8545|nr:hypothetical protein [Sphingopyxis sp.]MDZ3833104.1 hypothetical protein [Sphingopyxis sp.]